MATVESDFLFFIMKPLAIFAISIVGFILVFRKTKTKKRPVDYYTNPGTLYSHFCNVYLIGRELVSTH